MENLNKVLQKHGFYFKKAYGQNFLTDTALLDDIVEKSMVNSDDVVLEIGCGAGALTRALAKKVKKVVGYEIDQKLKPVLEETLGEFNNVEIVFGDILKQNLELVEKKLGEKYVMVANLPYYITTPIVMEFLEKAKNIKAMVIMVQEEVANRFSAVKGTADYGAITVAINLRGSASIIKMVGREKFTPMPNVDSAVVKIDIEEGKTDGIDLLAVRNAVRCGFSNRRKMLVNNLMNTYKISRAQAEKVLIECDISLTARGETLDYLEYIKLSNKLKES
ncbi:MAG: ribosomal RNA small subunit methyltransferase A [Clostridia bacterium]|nr:ribosomal RNA small subunit methyltransferase A [Clostridia bacterium]